MRRKTISLVGAILATAVMIPTVIITHGYIVRPHQVESLGDWIQVLLPIAPPVVALLSVILLWKSGKRQPVGKGIAWAVFCASSAYMLFQGFTLSTHYTLISQDGTAHWGMLQLPAIWIGLPLIAITIGIGSFVGWIVSSRCDVGHVKEEV
ncbi:MAG: hypothetical protein ACOX52_18830 [Verrucomicrobiota bacterium]